MIINFFKNKEYIYIFLIFLISILFNQYYGFIGVQPIDSFFPFNSGYDVLNGIKSLSLALNLKKIKWVYSKKN